MRKAEVENKQLNDVTHLVDTLREIAFSYLNCAQANISAVIGWLLLYLLSEKTD
jgi:hypothetical protein